jgi:hypothetical protein
MYLIILKLWYSRTPETALDQAEFDYVIYNIIFIQDLLKDKRNINTEKLFMMSYKNITTV